MWQNLIAIEEEDLTRDNKNTRNLQGHILPQTMQFFRKLIQCTRTCTITQTVYDIDVRYIPKSIEVSIQCRATIGSQAKAFRWRADEGPLIDVYWVSQ